MIYWNLPYSTVLHGWTDGPAHVQLVKADCENNTFTLRLLLLASELKREALRLNGSLPGHSQEKG